MVAVAVVIFVQVSYLKFFAKNSFVWLVFFVNHLPVSGGAGVVFGGGDCGGDCDSGGGDIFCRGCTNDCCGMLARNAI